MENHEDIKRELKETLKEINADKYQTAVNKVKFINEIRKGLGEEIKKNPSNIKIIKKTRFQKFIIFLKKIFTKF